ncbi:NAD(P)/FAD-dependent oxidoreductase [Nocardiopsis mangrovi]|uniref:NAD(P)/FAD-dependent oxidoreductase n=1 Tax=Nocardiopsis mangrovi TaxID=1179818 RepID=A0ABV9E447_9ACTN
MSGAMLDAVVVGGGPAGAVCATLLAREGAAVALLERDEFPRFHIGESMLPYMAGLLERLDLLDVVKEQGYVVKRGGEFIDPTGTKFFSPGVFRADFAKQGEGRHTETFQVERAHFDRVLVEQARAAGARVMHGAQVTDFLQEDDRLTGVGFRYQGANPRIRARYIIDASGRAGKIANRFGLRRSVDKLRMVAVYRHYTGLDERHNPGHEGDIQIGAHDDGWVWAIPLSADTVSVGTVMPREVFRSGTADSLFATHVARVPRITQRLTGTRPTMELRVETDYCYHTDTVTGPGWLIVGDAGCFGDPMFSGGVLVAMATAARAAATITGALADPAREQRLFDDYAGFFKTGYDTYIRLIHSFYDSELISAIADSTVPRDKLEMYMVRLLGGDFWSEHNPISEALRAIPEWDTFSPFEPVFGCPVYPERDSADREELAAGARP